MSEREQEAYGAWCEKAGLDPDEPGAWQLWEEAVASMVQPSLSRRLLRHMDGRHLPPGRMP